MSIINRVAFLETLQRERIGDRLVDAYALAEVVVAMADVVRSAGFTPPAPQVAAARQALANGKPEAHESVWRSAYDRAMDELSPTEEQHEAVRQMQFFRMARQGWSRLAEKCDGLTMLWQLAVYKKVYQYIAANHDAGTVSAEGLEAVFSECFTRDPGEFADATFAEYQRCFFATR